MRFVKVFSLVLAVSLLATPVMARCGGIMPGLVVHQAQGNIITSPGKEYGGWFWSPGKGNNLVNDASENPAAGIDSGVVGGVPADPAPVSENWLQDWSQGSGAVRVVRYNWTSAGVDGCADLNGNGKADPDEVVAVLVVDGRGEEYAMISAGGAGDRGWFLDQVNNGVPSMYGHPTAGVPMTPAPRPTFGPARDAGSGKVSVQVNLPQSSDIPTYDDMGGRRPMVQGFHLIQGEVLLAEVRFGTASETVTATPGEVLTLRTIFGQSGDKGFYVDGEARVPRVGETPEPADDGPGGAPDQEAGQAGDEQQAAVPPSTPLVAPDGQGQADGVDADKDGDEDTIMDDDDNCPGVANEEQEDMDEDGVGDICDSCPFDANENQEDGDGDGQGDACDVCPEDPENLDTDGDTVCDGTDNCVDVANVDQLDADGDGTGDDCDPSYDPYVLELTPSVEGTAAGKAIQVTMSVSNRSLETQKADVRVIWKDAGEAEVAWAADPECLKTVPLALELEPGETFSKECSWSVPADAAKGKAMLHLEVVHPEDEKVSASSEVPVRVR